MHATLASVPPAQLDALADAPAPLTWPLARRLRHAAESYPDLADTLNEAADELDRVRKRDERLAGVLEDAGSELRYGQ